MDEQLAIAQSLRYAEELRDLHAEERQQRALVEQALARLGDAYAATVRALAVALELRDDQTGNHAQRVTELALALTRRVAPELAEEPELEYGFLLHDVGKIGVPDAIMLKPGPLDTEELAQMRLHPALGERVIERVPYLGGLARDVVAAHHERWDGAGYPGGLAGTEIPLAARIFAVVDAFDAMVYDRPYRKALPLAGALQELARCAGSQFEPALVSSFLALRPRVSSGSQPLPGALAASKRARSHLSAAVATVTE